jgi:hypothetical protein
MDRRMTFFRRMFPAAMAIACLGFGLLVPACDAPAPGSDSGKETAVTRIIAQAPIPPIDATAPAKTETASFALG